MLVWYNVIPCLCCCYGKSSLFWPPCSCLKRSISVLLSFLRWHDLSPAWKQGWNFIETLVTSHAARALPSHNFVLRVVLSSCASIQSRVKYGSTTLVKPHSNIQLSQYLQMPGTSALERGHHRAIPYSHQFLSPTKSNQPSLTYMCSHHAIWQLQWTFRPLCRCMSLVQITEW